MKVTTNMRRVQEAIAKAIDICREEMVGKQVIITVRGSYYRRRGMITNVGVHAEGRVRYRTKIYRQDAPTLFLETDAQRNFRLPDEFDIVSFVDAHTKPSKEQANAR